MKSWDKHVFCVLMEHDYGDPGRGPSGDKLWFHENIRKLAQRTSVAWIDADLKQPATLRSRVLEAVRAAKPDLVFFIPYTDQFDEATLAQVREVAPTIAWFGDDHWRFDSYTRVVAPWYTHAITTDPLAIPDYHAIGLQPILSEWAAQPPEGEPPRPVRNPRYGVTFVGTANEVRKWFIDRLRKAGLDVQCFGHGWPNGRLGVAEMNELFTQSRINLNLSNSVPSDVSFIATHPLNFARWAVSKKRAEQVKARNFEIPMMGGFQLSKYALGLERHFVIGSEIAVFNTVDECAKQVKYFLDNEEHRWAVACAGAERARREHTYLHRLTHIFEQVWGA